MVKSLKKSKNKGLSSKNKFKLSLNNFLERKWRNLLIALATSIGFVGVLISFGLGNALISMIDENTNGGQKQRVAIARALVNQPDMIVADEPTGSLDSQSQEIVLEVFKSLTKSGKTVLIVTHNPEVAEYADVIIKMKDGEVVEEVKK